MLLLKINKQVSKNIYGSDEWTNGDTYRSVGQVARVAERHGRGTVHRPELTRRATHER